ncbi:FAD-binding oxidoreductase [Acidovorax sp.]|uniref:FAD-binding oxidoreductase n=1 Tax=Acidovorax sp. TaxID=1872122 RepID=UPI00262D64B1|nr:FAD-binding oxidoreductase [Acidovorax sp.]
MTTFNYHTAFQDLRQVVEEEWVWTNEKDILPYAVNMDPSGDVFPAGVVSPANADEVRRVIEIANRYRFPLHPISKGLQHGLGMATAVQPSSVTMSLGRLNKIISYDPYLGYVVIEPGVTFQQLYDFLQSEDAPYWISPTSGPVEASVLGNALDKGAGYTPFGNNFANLIGLEVILGDGRVLKTGDGALENSVSQFTHKGGFGPMLDALFAQSNYGVVVKAGLWLMPAPSAARGFVFTFERQDDIGRIADIAGRLKLLGAIPSTVSIANDQFCLGLQASRPIQHGTANQPPFGEADLGQLRQAHGVGAWNVIGCVYGREDGLSPQIEHIRQMFADIPGMKYLTEEDASQKRAFAYRFDIAKGIPNATEVDLYNMHTNGAALSFLPSVPFCGSYALEAANLSREICSAHGFAYLNQFLCSPRSMRNTQHIVFDSVDPESRSRAKACYSELNSVFQSKGYLVSRPPTIFQEEIMDGLGMHATIAREIKKVFDPNGILAPGRFGIRCR